MPAAVVSAYQPFGVGPSRVAVVSGREADPSDERLMLAVAEGDATALAELVDRHRSRAMGIAYTVVRDRAEAEDIVQDAFLRVWTRAKDWHPRDGSRFIAWFARITTNLAIDRKRKPTMTALDDFEPVASAGSDAEALVGGREIGERIQQALTTLPERQRLAFVLCQIDRLSNAEAAQVMGVSVGALELLLVRARKAIRRDLADLIEVVR